MSKKNKKLTVFSSIGGVIALILIFLLTINIIPAKKVMDSNPFIASKEQHVMIAAHRGGKNLNPENTFKAFDYSIDNFNIDILELDLCMTKDGYLVSSHNLTIDDCADVTESNYYVKDHTLAELQKFNFGYNFKDSSGNYPYRDLLNGVSEDQKDDVLLANCLRIATINEIFDKYASTDLKFILEIKDEAELGKKATDELISQIKQHNLLQRVIVGTFHDEIEEYLNNKYSEVYKGAAMASAAKFIISQMFKVNIFNNPSFMALQIPTEFEIGNDLLSIKLNRKTYINRAHKRNISVQYWTINDRKEMEELIELGADVIMTDNPDILYDLLVEKGYR